ncbi:MAG: transposase [Deltaproteobacteria bacterium]|nr:transposase [Deltaproteobacteria bacterium]
MACLLDATGNEVEHASISTTADELRNLVRRCAGTEPLLVGQEIGTQAFFAHDVVSAMPSMEIRSFNAYQLRMIAASRKKTDRRDALWIAKALQTGMTPHPVHIATGAVRRLRSLLAQRDAVVAERKRWLLRARSYVRAGGYLLPKASRFVVRLRDKTLGNPDGLELHVVEALDLCQRRAGALTEEVRRLDGLLKKETAELPAIQRLKTIPAAGDLVAVRIYAAVGDISRIPNARTLASYVAQPFDPQVRRRTCGLRTEC